jgi:hypothetical protein
MMIITYILLLFISTYYVKVVLIVFICYKLYTWQYCINNNEY